MQGILSIPQQDHICGDPHPFLNHDDVTDPQSGASHAHHPPLSYLGVS